MNAEPAIPARSLTMRRLFLGVPRRLFRHLQGICARVARHSGFLASLYFTFLSTRFYREHRAVLAGRHEFFGRGMADRSSFGGFRRNIHRLEKALIMLPRRNTFAEGYIGETVRQFSLAIHPESRIDAQERKWAGDVLSEYFAVVKDTPIIARARAEFLATRYSPAAGAPTFVPYAREAVEASGIPFDQLRKLFIERRSVRWFEERPVLVELLEQAVEAASWAPSACNRLPYRFHACVDPVKAAKVAALAGGTAGFAQNIPCLIVVVGDISNYVEERDRHLIYIDGALASMQLMLALQSLGLSTVPINWPDVEESEKAMARTLGLAPYERPVMLIGIGYALAGGLIPYSQKKPASMLLKIER